MGDKSFPAHINSQMTNYIYPWIYSFRKACVYLGEDFFFITGVCMFVSAYIFAGEGGICVNFRIKPPGYNFKLQPQGGRFTYRVKQASCYGAPGELMWMDYIKIYCLQDLDIGLKWEIEGQTWTNNLNNHCHLVKSYI